MRVHELGLGWSTSCFSTRKTLLRVGNFYYDFVSTILFLHLVLVRVFPQNKCIKLYAALHQMKSIEPSDFLFLRTANVCLANQLAVQENQ